MNRRDFLLSSTVALGAVFMPRIPVSGQPVTPAGVDCLNDVQWGFSDEEKKRLAGLIRKGLLDIRYVASPSESAGAKHFGWPVATRLPSGRVVILYQRAHGHGDEDSSPDAGLFSIYSDDLEHWLPDPPNRVAPVPGMHCIGHVTRRDGGERLLAITSGKPHMVHISDDMGQSWQTREDAFTGMLKSAAHVGPNLINHPDFGVVAAFGQETGKGGRGYLFCSKDAGQTWHERVWMNRAKARSVEPAIATWGPGHMVMIGREWSEDFAIGRDGFYGHTQHVYGHHAGAGFSDINFTTARTNIIGNPAAGLSCHDTADVIFNPVSGRIEMLQSHRWGGGLGKTGNTLASKPEDEVSSLNLWTIDPDALLAGSADWRFDGTIIERIGYSRKGNRDGLHPGGSVIDQANGLHHIFVYAGWRRSPSSIFMISRSLDTDRWRRAVLQDA